jgi:hypothetical protein
MQQWGEKFQIRVAAAPQTNGGTPAPNQTPMMRFGLFLALFPEE